MADKPEKVGDIMTREVVTVREEENLKKVMEGLDRFGFRHLPVVDGDKLVGLVTQRDLLMAQVSSLVPGTARDTMESQLEENAFIASVMSRDISTVTPETPIAEAARTMRDHKYGCLPVVDGDELVGIVTEADFLSLAIMLLEP
jgi:CBS domain-containing membrane protein